MTRTCYKSFWIFLFGLAFGASLSQAGQLEGVWKGAITTPAAPLAIEVQLASVEDETWSGTISIPIQGIKAYSLADVRVDGEKVSFAMDGIPGRPTFAGVFNETSETLAGTFTQGGQEMKFSLKYAGESAEGAPEPVLPTKGVAGEGVVGEWLGTLAIGPVRLRLALHVMDDGSGGLSGTMDSLDQGAMGIGIDRITFDAGVLEFGISQIDGRYKGELNTDGSEIVGTWTQMGNSNPLTFLRLDEAISVNRPQVPEAPFPYESREVEFRNEEANIALSGTLLIPEGEGPFPTVLFVSGSGPQDRDEALMGHRPFLVIADSLARSGIASLRYDDRGVGKSEGDHMGSTVQDFAKDALAGIKFLTRQEEVDTEAIGILGHSEGGLTGPMVATKTEELDFLVLLAPPGEALDKLLMRQTRDAARLRDLPEDLVARAATDQREELKLIKDPSLDRTEVEAALRENWERSREDYTEEELALLQINEGLVDQNIKIVSTPWFRSLMRLDPVEYLQDITIPALALFGEKDIQVAAEVNAEIVRDALEEAGNEDFHVGIREGLNHLFQHSPTGAIAEYGLIEETFDPATLDVIAGWINTRY